MIPLLCLRCYRFLPTLDPFLCWWKADYLWKDSGSTDVLTSCLDLIRWTKEMYVTASFFSFPFWMGFFSSVLNRVFNSHSLDRFPRPPLLWDLGSQAAWACTFVKIFQAACSYWLPICCVVLEPDRPLYYFRASKFVNWRVRTTWNLSIGGFRASVFVNWSVGRSVGRGPFENSFSCFVQSVCLSAKKQTRTKGLLQVGFETQMIWSDPILSPSGSIFSHCLWVFSREGQKKWLLFLPLFSGMHLAEAIYWLGERIFVKNRLH